MDSYKNVVIESSSGGRGGVVELAKAIFLPRGYPQSVSKDYLKYRVRIKR